jgi:hypothetical protein
MQLIAEYLGNADPNIPTIRYAREYVSGLIMRLEYD